jgi:hypothetical protein
MFSIVGLGLTAQGRNERADDEWTIPHLRPAIA